MSEFNCFIESNYLFIYPSYDEKSFDVPTLVLERVLCNVSEKMLRGLLIPHD